MIDNIVSIINIYLLTEDKQRRRWTRHASAPGRRTIRLRLGVRFHSALQRPCAPWRRGDMALHSSIRHFSLQPGLQCLFVCLFVCWVNKTRAVKPLRRFHSWILSFTQDGPAFSTKTARRALQFQLRSALSTSWRAGSPFKINNPCWSHWTRQALHQTHPKPPNRAPWFHLKTGPDTQPYPVHTTEFLIFQNKLFPY